MRNDENTDDSWNFKKSPMLILLIAGVISLIGISVGIYFAVKPNGDGQSQKKDILFGNGYDDDTCEKFY